MFAEDKNKDGLFKELLALDKIEKAPAGFTDSVMNTIKAKEGIIAEGKWSWSSWWLWGSILIAITGLVVIVFYVDFTFMGNIFEGIELDGSRMSQFFSKLGNGLIAVFEGFNVSSISITIIIAIGALFGIDRIFRRKPDVELPIF